VANKYIIPGPPIPLQRPRFNGQWVWDCQKGEKMFAATNLRFQHKGDPLQGPLHMHIDFFMKHAKKKGYHSVKPDLDNMIKFYADVCNGIVYEDDAQLAKITAEKIYSKEPRTEITITELLKERDNDTQ
jgi:Holliday junction resolvase RusA-like endonuclease